MVQFWQLGPEAHSYCSYALMQPAEALLSQTKQVEQSEHRRSLLSRNGWLSAQHLFAPRGKERGEGKS